MAPGGAQPFNFGGIDAGKYSMVVSFGVLHHSLYISGFSSLDGLLSVVSTKMDGQPANGRWTSYWGF